MKSVLKQFVLVVVAVTVLAEVYYRFNGAYITYAEKTWGVYSSYYGKIEDSWYNVFPPNTVRISSCEDFKYSYPTNNYGLCNKEILPASDTTNRILVFGDSFIEGVGAPYDSSIPRILEKQLQEKAINYEVINAGVSGSDLFYEYTLYRDKLYKTNPKVVIVGINSSDYIDFIQRGGMERFFADGTTHNRSAPWYEGLYIHSHFFRAIITKYMDFPYSGIFVSKKDYLIQTNAINKDFVALLKHFNKAVTQQHAQLLVVTYSIPSEIGENRDLAKTNKNNLKTLSASLRAQNIPCLCLMDLQENRFGAVAKNIYSYSHDGHFKPIGYSYMAQIIADSLSLSIVNP